MPQRNEDEKEGVEAQPVIKNLCDKAHENLNLPPYTWHPSVGNIQQISYVRRLECEHELLQTALLTVTSQMARLQFRIRQIISAAPCDRSKLIADLERVVFKEFYSLNQCKEELPLVERHHKELGDIKARQHTLIRNLRVRIEDFKTASDGLTMQTDFDPDWESYLSQACACPVPENGGADDEKLARQSRRHSRTSVAFKSSRTSVGSRRSAGSEHYWEDINSQACQTDQTYGRHMKRESRI